MAPDRLPESTARVASAGWIPVATPGPDFPAAIAGSDAPEKILRAVDDLRALMTSVWHWVRDVHLDMLNRRTLPAAVPEPPPAFDISLWSRGSFHSILHDEPRVQATGERLIALQREAQRLAEAAGGRPNLLSAEYARFFDHIIAFNTDLHELQAEVWNRLASIDPLTGLATRPAMFKRLTIEGERHARTHQPCCLAILDLDNFKDINDTHGHGAGDTVLRSIASLLAASVRPYDAVFRFGGDEFVLCLPNADLRTAWAIVERLRRKVAAWAVPLRDGVVLNTTLSIGVAPMRSDTSARVALEVADAALYAAKRAGRNTVVVRLK
jgi:diguanylate cyclase (GGDEF)-like protein